MTEALQYDRRIRSHHRYGELVAIPPKWLQLERQVIRPVWKTSHGLALQAYEQLIVECCTLDVAPLHHFNSIQTRLSSESQIESGAGDAGCLVLLISSSDLSPNILTRGL